VKETLKLANMDYDNLEWLPIEVVNKACKVNSKNTLKPVYSQYLWFCLDGTIVKRKLPSGKIVTPKVCFNPVYLANKKKLIILIRKAMKRLSPPYKENFSKLVDRTRQSLDGWLANRAKIPLTAVIKACQILKLDVWKVIDRERLYASGKSKQNSVLFSNKETNEIRQIITWLKAEGCLDISSTEINLVQNKEGKDSLQDIVNKIVKFLHVPWSNIHIGVRCDKPNAVNVRIFSAPLRQILCLKYNIPLGFKSYDIDFNEINRAKNKEEKLQILSKIFESEGSFGFRKLDLPDFHITSASFTAIKSVNDLLKDLGYNPYGPARHHSAFKTGIMNVEASVKLCYDILPYFKHKEKIKYILFGNNNTTHGFSSENYLIRLKKRLNPPKHWLLISWIHGIISRKFLEKARGLSFKHVEEVLNGERT
jgi:hypothetical protein